MPINNIVSTINLDSDSLLLQNDTVGVLLTGSHGLVKDSGLQVDNTWLSQTAGLISSASIKGMYTTPTALIADGFIGSGYYIYVQDIQLQSTGGSTQYTAGGDFYCVYGTTQTNPKATQVVAAAEFTGLANNETLFMTGPPPTQGLATTDLNNKGVYLTCDTQDFATGDFDLIYIIRFKAVQIF